VSNYKILASGVLKGFDALLNLVLDNCTEYLRGYLYFINCSCVYK